MSTTTRKTPFVCTNDCSSMGCPGHILTLRYHNTSDTVSILVDDDLRLITDDATLDAICELHQQKD